MSDCLPGKPLTHSNIEAHEQWIAQAEEQGIESVIAPSVVYFRDHFCFESTVADWWDALLDIRSLPESGGGA